MESCFGGSGGFEERGGGAKRVGSANIKEHVLHKKKSHLGLATEWEEGGRQRVAWISGGIVFFVELRKGSEGPSNHKQWRKD